jgi:hypothetical protein
VNRGLVVARSGWVVAMSGRVVVMPGRNKPDWAPIHPDWSRLSSDLPRLSSDLAQTYWNPGPDDFEHVEKCRGWSRFIPISPDLSRPCYDSPRLNPDQRRFSSRGESGSQIGTVWLGHNFNRWCVTFLNSENTNADFWKFWSSLTGIYIRKKFQWWIHEIW